MSSILPEYEYDIFISYRQKDNKYDGWVTEFVENLTKELAATFKEDISIYFDENPHDGLLETHNVNKSLEGKLRSLVFIPIISQTYCDPKSFAWEHEFVAFNEIASHDKFGKSIRLANGNIAERILPVQIHDLDSADKELYEAVAEAVLRPVGFIYSIPGVNRPLRTVDDEQIKSPDQILYRDQINKVARAIKEIVGGLKNFQSADVLPKTEILPEPEPISIPTQKPQEALIKKPRINYRPIVYALPFILIAIGAFYFVPNWLNKQKAKNELLPAIQKLLNENFRAPTEAYDLALEAEKYISDDSSLIKLWPTLVSSINMDTDPPGAEVYWKDYDKADSDWRLAGTTPLKEARFPRGYLRMKVVKEGYQPIEYAGPSAYKRLGPEIEKLKLDKVGELPENMVRIPKNTTSMNIVGLEQLGPKTVGEFLIDKYEVTNLEYKKFMDAGGYSNKAYWQYPIILNGNEITLEKALSLFVDRTERLGPANWEAGTYADGEQDHPVAGVSWYEAAAYAAYADKQLPTIFHWAIVASTSRTEFIVPASNFGGQSTTAVGSLDGYSTFGLYDIAGNVREWCFNESTGGQRFILGGGWNEPIYSFNDAYTQPMMDRSITNGFRCIKEILSDSASVKLRALVTREFRDYKKEKPVDDATFNIMRSQFAYDKTPLESKIESRVEGEFWTAEKISFNAGYNNERMEAYLYLPKDFNGPYQPILFFGGSGDIYSRKYNPESIGSVDFLLKSGRAIIRPIYKGTHERFDELGSDLPDESVFYKDHVIMWRKDIGRALDYLETREDIRMDELGYLGWSWGGYLGGIMPAVERRIKAVVLNVGGMVMNKSLPEVDQLNFLPRVTQPVLMLNGKYDMFFPLETSQKPMFELLGTPKPDKKVVVFESGHLVPKTDFVKESLLWFDQYLGPSK